MIDVLFDCDLTMGLPGRDVDDGLALLHLLGSPRVRLAGITSTFGNSTLAEVHACLERTLEELGLAGLPLHRGAAQPLPPAGGAPPRSPSPAARFLAAAAAARRGRCCLLATGSLTNLAEAELLRPGFLSTLKRVVVMGGITEPLVLGGRVMEELNFSVDPEAARTVLRSGARLSVVTGNLCLPLLLERGRFERLLARLGRQRAGRAFAAWLEAGVVPWFEHIHREFALPGFHPWDATAAVCLTHPGLFDRRRFLPACTAQDLRRGLLRPEATTGAGQTVHVPERVLDPARYWRVLLRAWGRGAARFPT